jgi:hypothetical protein
VQAIEADLTWRATRPIAAPAVLKGRLHIELVARKTVQAAPLA